MKWILMNLVIMYLVFCADDVDDCGDTHSSWERMARVFLWPITITEWFRSQNQRLHRLLNILWTVLIAGWLLSLMADRLPG